MVDSHVEALACRYVAAIGLIILFYDHLLTLGDEVRYIWKARWSVPKALFLLVRYAVPLALIIQVHQLSRAIMPSQSQDKTDTFCQIWFNIAVSLGILTMAIGNFIVLLRSCIMFKKNKHVISWIIGLFVCSQIVVVVSAIIVLIRINPSLAFKRDLGLCTINRRSVLGILYAPAMLFDGIAVLAVLLNAVSRPHRHNETIWAYLYQNGFYYFLLLFLLRLINFLTTLFSALNIVFLAICFIWAMTTVTFSRLVLDFRKSAKITHHVNVNSFPSSNSTITTPRSSDTVI